MQSTPPANLLDALPGYRAVRGLRTRGLAREVLAVREGPAGFRRFCSVRLALADDARRAHALTREAAILSRLHHPSILPAHDFLYAQGWLALVLAFDGAFTVDSVAISADIHAEPLDLEAAMFVAHAVFDALAHAHGKRDRDGRPLVHGDIHPANILVRSTGNVWMRGFRGAECLLPLHPGSRIQTEPGPYAAPELLSGSPASPASDVFGAAALVWHLLVGRPPPSTEIPPLAHVCPDLFPEVVAVLDVCLSTNPQDRRLRAGTVAATLGRVVGIHAGRDCLERRYDTVLRTLPPNIQSFCAGTLPGHSSLAWSVPPDQLPRVRRDSTSIPAVGITTLPPPVCEPNPNEDSPSLGLDRDTRPDDDPSSHSDTPPPFPIGEKPLWRELPGPLAPTSTAMSLPPPPLSLAPVGRDVRPQTRTAGIWHAAAVLGALALFPLSWFAGRTLVATTTPSAETTARAPSASPSPVPTPPRSTASGSAAVIASASSPPPTTSSSPVSFSQSRLTVEGPPHGIVFLNGKPVARTGEPLTTRGCGLRFVRVAQSPEDRRGQGFRWLSKGQTVNLPCGGTVVVRPASDEATTKDTSTSERD